MNLQSGEMKMKPRQNLHGGRNPLFENITLGIAIISAVVALVTALNAHH